MITADADQPNPGKVQEKYHCLKNVDERERDVITQLEKIEIENVAMRDLTLREAFSNLRKAVAGEQGGGVINLVIRGFPADEKKVTIQGRKMNYAAVVDAICRQTGQQWEIEFDESTRVPILVLSPNKRAN